MSDANGPLVVACAANRGYAMPLAVMLRSLERHLAAATRLEVFAFDDGLDPDDRLRVRDSLSDRVELHWVEPAWPRDLVLPVWPRMPRTSFVKLWLGEWLPASRPRALWLDCDIVVCADLTPLWLEPFEDRILLAAQDPRVPRVSSRLGLPARAREGIRADAEYFNAGLLLLDADAWRRERIARRAVDVVARHYNQLRFGDQDVLNATLAGRWRRLDSEWNHDPTLAAVLGRGTRSIAPRVAHFSGRLKPWVFGAVTPCHERWFDHLDETVWRGWRPRVALGRRLQVRFALSRMRRPLFPLEQWWTVVSYRLSRRQLRPR